MHTRLAAMVLLFGACTVAAAPEPPARAALPSAEMRTAAPIPNATAGQGPGQRAAAPMIVVAPDAADRIDALLAQQGAGVAVIVANGRSGDVLYELDADEPVFAASLYKLAVLLEAERRIDAGTLRATQLVAVTEADQSESGSFTPTGSVLTVDEALDRAIMLSDNASALALIRLLGIPAIHTTLEREGIGSLRFTSDGAVTTARAVATFFGKLVRGSLVSREASARMLARLARQRTDDRLPAALPAGAVIAHKTGNLGFATHDAGIIRGPGDAPIVLVVLTWDSDEQEAIELIKRTALLVYEGLTSLR
jgi:beta-lactamase class A